MRTRRVFAVSAVIGLAMTGITVSAALAEDDLPRAIDPNESQVSSEEFSAVDLSEGVFSDAFEPITSKYEDVFGGRVFDRQTATTTIFVTTGADPKRRVEFDNNVESIKAEGISVRIVERDGATASELLDAADTIGIGGADVAARLGVNEFVSVRPDFESATLVVGLTNAAFESKSSAAEEFAGIPLDFIADDVYIDFQGRTNDTPP